MSMSQSNEHTACTICRENLGEHDDELVTACSHRFPRNCLLPWLKKNTSCPQCRTVCSSRDFHQATGCRTRSRTAFQESVTGNTSSSRNLQNPRESLQKSQPQAEVAAGVPAQRDQLTIGNEAASNEEDTRIRNIVSAVISARSASMFDGLESRVSQIIEQRLENTLANLVERLNLNPSPPVAPAADVSQIANTPAQVPLQNRSTPVWPRENPPLPNHSHSNFSNQINQLRLSDVSSIPHSSRVAN
ncbi:E3 ubiquitin-protein ligase RHF2A-like [Rhagoletis pomonella]|uniref:E3 ubiquitin-protein ligase RHF2A-like n=1 Tax=Rhagoletis pomonella TaxID=28610 RepID=UPI0017808233|nr:E3 ubiquitin-protein ligase RHF2A-like [Rhagoletis pomonella]